ncbi:prephenate dehydrogenase/arogenate dehydrogenase family protein [Salinisphaera sp. T31B1]|uniref:prephenate dehydrogenase n=1 Tax=Salinisphaera sp. T31B1 TaxID=727963 RepID=UPI00333E8B91
MTGTDDAFADTPVAIVGLGLIGGSIARGLRQAGHRGRLTGCVVDAADVATAERLGLVDHVSTELGEAVAGAALVIVAVPVGAMASVFAELGAHLGADTAVTDVGSTKMSVIADARAGLGKAIGRFVPGHPIAGTEHSGLEAGVAGLFNQRRVILAPTPETDADALARVEAFWQSLGAQISEMDAAHHDEVLAATSHLPHVLAFALVDTLARMAERTEIFAYAAGGFADFTRIASSDPALWSDIVTANRQAIGPVLDRYIGDLEQLRAAIAAHDGDTLVAAFGRAKQARDRFAQRSTNDKA